MDDAPSAEDEELLRALRQTEEIGELEATDLMQFAYQIATGMVRMLLMYNYSSKNYYGASLSQVI